MTIIVETLIRMMALNVKSLADTTIISYLTYLIAYYY